MGRPDMFPSSFQHKKAVETNLPKNQEIHGGKDEHLKARAASAFDAHSAKTSEPAARKTYTDKELFDKYLEETRRKNGYSRKDWNELGAEKRFELSEKYAKYLNQSETFARTAGALGISSKHASPTAGIIAGGTPGLLFSHKHAESFTEGPNKTLQPRASAEETSLLGVVPIVRRTVDHNTGDKSLQILGIGSRKGTQATAEVDEIVKNGIKIKRGIRGFGEHNEPAPPKALPVEEHKTAGNALAESRKTINHYYHEAGTRTDYDKVIAHTRKLDQALPADKRHHEKDFRNAIAARNAAN